MGLAESRSTMLTLCSVVPMLTTGGGSTVLLTPHLLMASVHAVERISVSTDSQDHESLPYLWYPFNPTFQPLCGEQNMKSQLPLPRVPQFISLSLFMFPDTGKTPSTSYICPLEEIPLDLRVYWSLVILFWVTTQHIAWSLVYKSLMLSVYFSFPGHRKFPFQGTWTGENETMIFHLFGNHVASIVHIK